MSGGIDLHGKLRDRYESTQWATAFEVPNVVGGGNRRCDMMAMHLWKSKGGLCLHGHEIKASRSDWLKEIDDPSKAEEFAKRCHYWWIVAPKGIVKLEELPPSWGLLQCSERSALRVASAAQVNRSPEPIDWPFFAACMRAFSEQSDIENKLRKARDQGYRDAVQRMESRAKREATHKEMDAVRRLESLQKAVGDFEERSGVKISAFRGRHLGDSFRVCSELMSRRGNIGSTIRTAKEATANLAELLTFYEGIEQKGNT